MNIAITDKSGHLSEKAFSEEIERAEEIRKRILKGEENYKASLGWLNTKNAAAPDTIEKINALAKKVRENSDVFVLIGVGGSNNAARSVIEALKDRGGIEILYMGNTLSPYALNKAIDSLNGKDFTIDCIAKNFETLEPGSSFRLLREVMAKRYSAKECAERTICTGTYGSSLEALCRKEGYTFLSFPLDIGGRYSALTNVGLLPMAIADIDINALAKGASDMEAELKAKAGKDNIALLYAAARHLLHKEGYSVELLSSFEPQLRHFYKWWIQLFAESEGKEGKGLLPSCAEYSEELHSLGQFIQDGSPLLFETFLSPEEQQSSIIVRPDGKNDHFDYLNGMDFFDINKAAFKATLSAHSEKCPCLVISFPKIDEYNFGQLFYFFEFSCYVSASLLGVNPFDQEGVEAYKRQMFKALGK